MSDDLVLPFPPELVDAIAKQAAALVLAEFSVREDAKPYLTVDEAAAFIGAKPQRIYDLRSAGRLGRHGDGRKALVKRAELEAYLDNRKRRS